MKVVKSVFLWGEKTMFKFLSSKFKGPYKENNSKFLESEEEKN